MNIQANGTRSNILVSTVEGYPKDKTVQSKKKQRGWKIHFSFTGPDAPVKAVKAIMQKYGVTKEDLP